jgi:hypothetical protein
MDPLDKLEMILNGMITKKQKEIDIAQGEGIQLSSVYMYGIAHEKTGLEKALWQLRAIKENASGVSDESVKKMYGSPNNQKK